MISLSCGPELAKGRAAGRGQRWAGKLGELVPLGAGPGPGMPRWKISALLDQPGRRIVPRRPELLCLAQILHSASDRDPTASLGGLLRILIDLIVRKLFIKLRILEVNEGTQAELLHAKSKGHMERVRLGKATQQYK